MLFSVGCVAVLELYAAPQLSHRLWGFKEGFLTVISVKLFPHMVYKAPWDPKG